MKPVATRVPCVNGKVVLLPGHTDAEIGVHEFHYHVDRRYHPDHQENVVVLGEVEWVDGLVVREDPWFKSGVFIYLRIWEVMEKRRSKCNVCPHKGLVIRDGVCQGHGLRFKSGWMRAPKWFRCGSMIVPVGDQDPVIFHPGQSQRVEGIQLLDGKFDVLADTKFTVGDQYLNIGDTLKIHGRIR